MGLHKFGVLREETNNKERLSAKIRMDRETRSIASDENSARHDRAKISPLNRFRSTLEEKEIAGRKLCIDFKFVEGTEILRAYIRVHPA